ncbi:MAG: ammonia channel protein, partial [Polaromonas sp.]
MKKLLASLLLGLSLLSAGAVRAQAPAETPAASAPAASAVAETKPEAAPVPAVLAAPAAATAAPAAGPAAAPAPVPNKGDTAWMMVSTILVILMVVPGLALFYGGLVRSK